MFINKFPFFVSSHGSDPKKKVAARSTLSIYLEKIQTRTQLEVQEQLRGEIIPNKYAMDTLPQSPLTYINTHKTHTGPEKAHLITPL